MKFDEKALFIVDMQNDFCPGGALEVSDGDKIVPVINSLMGKFNFIFASKDWHPADSKHFEKWPIHCIRNSVGAEFQKKLDIAKINKVFYKGTSNKDDGYSAFEATNENLKDYLESIKVTELYVCGLALDYCVKATAIDAVKHGFETFIISDATKAVTSNYAEIENLIINLKKKGIKFILSKDVKLK